MTFFELSKVKSAIANSDALCGETKIVTIDGPAGSGKTTLAHELSISLSDANGPMSVVHLDELYEGWDDALGQKLFDRIEAWVLTPIKNGLSPKHLTYDWHQSKYASWSELPLTPIVIIEGVGAAQQIVRETGATTYWLDIEPEIGLRRVLDRDGAHIEVQMRQWQVDQDKHFARDETRENCEVKLTS